MGINRNIVECKLWNCIAEHTVSYVLIETLWNVNADTFDSISVSVCVLIETLWNVN